MYETLVFIKFKKKIKIEIKQMKSLTYSLDLILLNKYLEVVIQCLELQIFIWKVEFSIYKKKNSE